MKKVSFQAAKVGGQGENEKCKMKIKIPCLSPSYPSPKERDGASSL
jgi:hypothetical protein